MKDSLTKNRTIGERVRQQGIPVSFLDDGAPNPLTQDFDELVPRPDDSAAQASRDSRQRKTRGESDLPDSTGGPKNAADPSESSLCLNEERSGPANGDSGQRTFQSIVGAASAYRNGSHLDYMNHRVECSLHTRWGWNFRGYLDYEADSSHFVTLVVRLAHDFDLEQPKASRLLFRAGACRRFARPVPEDDGHVFVKAFAVDVQHPQTIPTIVKAIFADTLRLLNDDSLRTALAFGKATLDGEPDRTWSDA